MKDSRPGKTRHCFFEKIEITTTPLDVYRALKKNGPGVLLESARFSKTMGRYSLVGARPSFIFYLRDDRARIYAPGRKTKVVPGDPFECLKKLLHERRIEKTEGMPPFSGGAVGFVGYEAKHWADPAMHSPRRGDLGLPCMYFLFLEEGVLFDHDKNNVYLFCAGRNRGVLCKRLSALKSEVIKKTGFGHSHKKIIKDIKCPRPLFVESSVKKRDFLSMVKKTKEHISRGDIFQANLSQRMTFSLKEPPESVYEKLKKINPGCFFGILDGGDFQILSGSPERLLKLEGRCLETRPIAGTRSRKNDPALDRKAALDLLLSPKERAEHIMLVDLERNDLGRVAEYGSVAVDELMTIEDYSHVKHIVSNIRATLRKELSAVDAFRAFFPGGTITGAPKIRSTQIIDDLEPAARGPYTGSMGYFSFTGDMDFNIIIRSLVMKNGLAHLQVGAGIVADSDPRKEYDETLYKAEAVLGAIFGRARAGGILRKLRSS